MILPFNPQSNLPPMPFGLVSSAPLTLSFPTPAFGPQFPLPCTLTLSFTSPALWPSVSLPLPFDPSFTSSALRPSVLPPLPFNLSLRTLLCPLTPSLTSLQGEVYDGRAPLALLPVRYSPDITAILGVGLHISYPQRRLSSVNEQQISY